MKRYNKINSKILFTWIFTSILVFLFVVNVAYAYFTAEFSLNSSFGTATLTIQFSDETDLFTNSQPITSQTYLLPGDTISASGKVENVGDLDAYVVIKFKLSVKKAEEENPVVLEENFYTLSDGVATEIKKVDGEYTNFAFVINNDDEESFEFTYTFDFNTYGNEYKNATVSYSLEAYALQTATITDVALATEMLIEEIAVS